MRFNSFMNSLDQPRIVKAIQEAEAHTTGEIRLCVARAAEPDPLEAARRAFASLGMEKTRDRNAVILLVAPTSQTFAIFGDEGIDRHCGPDFWAQLASGLHDELAAGRATEALERAVAAVGEALKKHFPKDADDSDELPNTIATV